VKKAEKKIENKHGRLIEPDKSIHTVSSLEGEVESRLDQIEADEELGYAKRKKPLPSLAKLEEDRNDK
jgi:hypothetical protein